MARGKVSRGTCLFCLESVSKSKIHQHLETCSQRQVALAARAVKGKEEALYHLRVQDAYSSEFWLELEVKASSTLKQLDSYLRDIWLECCGHMSQFGDFGQNVGMQRKVGDVFKIQTTLLHLYDFGTTSETKLSLIGTRSGYAKDKHPIELLARNELPQVQCQECEAVATHLCTECIYEHGQDGYLCDEHVKSHPHSDYGEPIEFVNSPRLGMCGYTGPAEPPY